MIVLNDVLKGKHSVAIGGHIRPDGDCVGSTIGLYLYLTTYYPEIETDLYLEEIPEAFQMMGHRDVPKHEIVEGKVYDLFISLDTVKTNAEKFETPYNEELHRTIIHGILHLCGINDKGPGEREIMEENENKALAILPGECRES